MIAYLKGTLEEVGNDYIVVEVNGIGYHVKVSLRVLEVMPSIGEKLKIYTYTYVREDILALYGFLSKDDLEMFLLLLAVNGVGPKGALGILSVFSAHEIKMSILAQDVKTLSKAPGIGVKTAQRMLLELKDKISLEEALEESFVSTDTANESGNMEQCKTDAVEALTALGYLPAESLKAVKAVEVTPGMDSEAILKAALKHLF